MNILYIKGQGLPAVNHLHQPFMIVCIEVHGNGIRLPVGSTEIDVKLGDVLNYDVCSTNFLVDLENMIMR